MLGAQYSWVARSQIQTQFLRAFSQPPAPMVQSIRLKFSPTGWNPGVSRLLGQDPASRGHRQDSECLGPSAIPGGTRRPAWQLSRKGFYFWIPYLTFSLEPERACKFHPPMRVPQVLEEQLSVHSHPGLLSSGPHPSREPALCQAGHRAVMGSDQNLSTLSGHPGCLGVCSRVREAD